MNHQKIKSVLKYITSAGIQIDDADRNIMQSIENKVILITGAAGNLGRVVAERALSYGARIIVTDWFGNQLENLFKMSFEFLKV